MILERRLIDISEISAYQIATSKNKVGKYNNYGNVDFRLIEDNADQKYGMVENKVEIELTRHANRLNDIWIGVTPNYVGMLEVAVNEAKKEIAKHS